MVEPELVGLPGRPEHGTPRVGSGSLSMQPVSCTPRTQADVAYVIPPDKGVNFFLQNLVHEALWILHSPYEYSTQHLHESE